MKILKLSVEVRCSVPWQLKRLRYAMSIESKRATKTSQISVCLRLVIFDYDWLIASQLFNVFIKRQVESGAKENVQKTNEQKTSQGRQSSSTQVNEFPRLPQRNWVLEVLIYVTISTVDTNEAPVNDLEVCLARFSLLLDRNDFPDNKICRPENIC